jgi:hypothetical protein
MAQWKDAMVISTLVQTMFMSGSAGFQPVF